MHSAATGTEPDKDPGTRAWPGIAITALLARFTADRELNSLLAEALHYRRSLIFAGILMLAQSAVALTLPWFAGELTRTLLGGEAAVFSSSHTVFLIILLIFTLQALLNISSSYLLARSGEHIVSALRIRVYEHLQSLPLEYHYDRRKGDVLSLLTRDVDILSGFITGTLVNIAPLGLIFAGAWIMMLYIHWPLACLAGLLMPLTIIAMKLISRRIRPLSREVSEAHADSVTTAEENLSILPIIKAFTHEGRAARQYQEKSRRVLALSNCLHLTMSTLRPVMRFITARGIMILLWIASTVLAPAALVGFLLYGVFLARPMSGLAALWGDTQHARAAMDRLHEVFSVQPEPVGSSACELPAVKGSILFEQVNFRYSKRETVLEDFDLEVRAGETVAITGVNGAGKSSLANLLLRFFEPQSGCIRVDGYDIAHVSLASLRAQIGLVPQSILLVNGSIRDNIAFGHSEPDQGKLEAAAEAACAHEFIRSLENGYDTVVGERGIKLSGGQQQRIALARALLKNPPILILDEATSMFDPAAEEKFLTLTEDSFKDRTVILITHRSASLTLADRVLVMDNGRLISTRAVD